MLTFEKFCETQDDKISDEDTIAKYNDYKLDFCKQEYEKFFQAHKDEQCSDQNGGNSTSSQINRVAKNESATEESDGMAVLLKRVPYKPIASSSATLNQDLRSKTLKQNAITIRDTCVSFAEGDIQASVNRDLRRRIRTVNAISNHRQVVQNDIRQAACLLALYDYKRKMFVDDEVQNPSKDRCDR
ncbi:DUF3546 domain-containing protein [Aphelenchoides besseyi]|nr:DUF3546 domain-containing protein [Aphelenchoides besseyi]